MVVGQEIIYIVISFGKKPIIGGRPPRDRRRIEMYIIDGFEDDILFIGEFIIILFRDINIGIIIIEYIIRYMIDINGRCLIVNLYIHPMWVIDEAAIIDFSLVWLIPKRDPTIAFIAQITVVNVVLIDNINVIILIGANFCQVDRIIQVVHEIDDITDGNQ